MPPLPIPQHDVPRGVPLALSLIAGYVDAVTFLGLFGFFIAQVTGSYVFMGAGVVSGAALGWTQILAVPVFFLAGVMATLVAAAARAARARPLVWTMLLELALLAAMTASGLSGAPFAAAEQPWAVATALFGIATMGVQAALVRLLIRGAPSTNVMTMNTAQLAVDVGQFVVAWRALWREPADKTPEWLARVGRQAANTAVVMVGFFSGTLVGTLAFGAGGFVALVLPLTALLALWLWAVAATPGAGEG